MRLSLVASACFFDGSARTRRDTHADVLGFVRFGRGEDRDCSAGADRVSQKSA